MNDIHSLSHTKWNCKYHVVFAPKYRRKIFYGEKRAEIGAILRQLCDWKGINNENAGFFIKCVDRYNNDSANFYGSVDVAGMNDEWVAE